MDNVIIGKIYCHKTGGLNYRVEGILLDATHSELGATPKSFVLYTQLEKGKYPQGTQGVRELTDFLENFEIVL